MKLYEQWTEMVIDFVKHHGEAAFWDKYGSIEKKIYSKLLSERTCELKGKVEDLAKEYDTDLIYFIGFIDGINESLDKELDTEDLEKDSEIDIKINVEKLYFNMLDAKADYLYNLPQWEGIFSPEKRKEIRNEWRASKTVVNENKIGRNDPCPCGSGKKYKKCCGKNK